MVESENGGRKISPILYAFTGELSLQLLRVEKADGERASYAKKVEFYAELGVRREGSLRLAQGGKQGDSRPGVGGGGTSR